MKFDVIIGNPPYQLSDGLEGANFYRASAIYHLFIDKAIELNPRYVSMIVPSRWMTNTAEGISNEWTNNFINSGKIKSICDYEDSTKLFNQVLVRGGINYFLWDRNHNGKCEYEFHSENGDIKRKAMKLDSFNLGFVVRDLNAHSIIKKVNSKEDGYYKNQSTNFSDLVGPKHFFDKGKLLATNWREYKKEKCKTYNIKFYVSEHTNKVPYGWIKESDVPKNKKAINLHKIYISAGGGIPRYGEPGSVCSETYLVIGYNHCLSKEEILNIMRYMSTKFFRFLMGIKQKARSATRGVYQLIPLQDWSESWTDEKLYKKYNLTQDEIDYIESTTSSMDISNELNIAKDLN
ncbi:MAG: hypothetical protein GX355_00220 [Globicatella sulfidifaciens]|uniref:Type II methyltransferase M.TaqI-like domain-containing protein n=2 Tax=Globicatella sulfidifaciens TaxID=136093 RepID=A0A7X8C1I0_9LACT|nr:hypothetical protein [Globicatella sulfidifaciens]